MAQTFVLMMKPKHVPPNLGGRVELRVGGKVTKQPRRVKETILVTFEKVRIENVFLFRLGGGKK